MSEKVALLINDIRIGDIVVACSYGRQRIPRESTKYFCV